MAEQSKQNTQSTSNEAPDHNECMRILNLVVDGEANNEEKKFFEQHLQNCMPYYEIYNVDMAIKELIRKNGYAHSCPEGLADEIKEKIKEIPAQQK